jgi:hypothetical protein
VGVGGGRKGADLNVMATCYDKKDVNNAPFVKKFESICWRLLPVRECVRDTSTETDGWSILSQIS